MNEKKRKYQSTALELPSLKKVLTDVPTPDPIFARSPFRGFQVEKPDVEVRGALSKLIGFMKETK